MRPASVGDGGRGPHGGSASPLSDKSSSNSCLSASDILQLGEGLLDQV